MIHVCLRGASIALVGLALAVVASDVRGNAPTTPISPKDAIRVALQEDPGIPESYGSHGTAEWTAAPAGGFSWSMYTATANGLQMQTGAQSFSYSFAGARHGSVNLLTNSGVAPALAAPGHVTIDRGAVRERYEIRGGGVEQLFDVYMLPGSGDLVIRGLVNSASPFQPERSNDQHLTFGDFNVSKAIAFDAAGSQQPLALAYVDGGIEITVPEAWLTSATLPITIDPFYTVAMPIDAPTDSNFVNVINADVCYNAEQDEYFVVYAYGAVAAPQNMDVFGRRINAQTGLTIGAPIAIETGFAADAMMPAVAWNSDEDTPTFNTYLVAWCDQPVGGVAGNVYHVRGRILNSAGASLSAQKFDISNVPLPPPGQPNFANYSTACVEREPDIAFDGTNFCVVWSRATQIQPATFDTTSWDCRYQRVSPGGGLLGGGPQGALYLDQANLFADARRPSITFLGGAANCYVAAWSQAPTFNAPGGVWMATINTTTGILGTAFQASSDAVLDHDWTSIAASVTSQEAFVVWDSGTARQNNPYQPIGTVASTQINSRRATVGANGGTLALVGTAQTNIANVVGGATAMPKTAWSETDNQYVVTWMINNLSTPVGQNGACRLARVQAGTGAIVQNDVVVSTLAAADEIAPFIAARTGTQEALVGWIRFGQGATAPHSWFHRLHTTGSVAAGPGVEGGDNGNQGINDMFCGAATAGSWLALLLLGSALLILTRKSS